MEFGSMGTDLPSEPMMVMLLGIALLWMLTKTTTLDKKLFLHPISLVMICHLAWIAFSSLHSTFPLVSWKYSLAKLWYLIPFFYLPMMLLSKEKGYRKIFTLLAPCLFVAVAYVLARHAAMDFSFASSNKVVRPIFRNHVNYAVMLVAFLPYYVYLLRTSQRNILGWKYFGLVILSLIHI